MWLLYVKAQLCSSAGVLQHLISAKGKDGVTGRLAGCNVRRHRDCRCRLPARLPRRCNQHVWTGEFCVLRGVLVSQPGYTGAGYTGILDRRGLFYADHA